jgi:hypothetical protein
MNEINLRELTLEQRQEIFVNKEDTVLNLQRNQLFDGLEDLITQRGNRVEFRSPQVEERELIQLAFHSLNGNGSRLILLWIRTYLEGGRVFFSKITESKFQASIKFPKEE